MKLTREEVIERIRLLKIQRMTLLEMNIDNRNDSQVLKKEAKILKEIEKLSKNLFTN